MTDHPAIAQLRRIPVIIVLTLALLLSGLLLMERTGGASDAGSSDRVEFVNLKNDKPSKSKGNHEKHCNDGKGKDDVKNKHCRNISP